MPAMESPRERALTATGDELAALLHHHATDVLLALLDNPAIDEPHVCVLLDRKDIPKEVLEEVASRKPLLKSYRVKRALVFHPRTPRLIGVRLVRELYLMDLVQLALLPAAVPELKINAEEQLIARLPQLPLGQKVTLARRGPARAAGVLLAEGHPQVLEPVLDNPHLTEAQVLKVLSREKLPQQAVQAISHHRKWSLVYNIRLALIRHPASTLSTVLAFLPELTVSDLRELASPGIVPESLRKYLHAEIQRRTNKPERAAQTTPPPGDATQT
jgi:predicted regulator of amino acid metabolism with ACT domain